MDVRHPGQHHGDSSYASRSRDPPEPASPRADLGGSRLTAEMDGRARVPTVGRHWVHQSVPADPPLEP